MPARSPTALPRQPGRPSLFRRKNRAPVSVTLIASHHAMLRRAVRRLGLTRADVLGLLVELHADRLTRDDVRRVADSRS